MRDSRGGQMPVITAGVIRCAEWEESAIAVAISRTEHDSAGLRRLAAASRDSDAARRMLALALVLPHADSQAMNLHLAEISTQVRPGAHAVLILDGAGWHQPGGRLRVPDNISLLPLPPYSPQLNPVENVWQFLRQNQLIPAPRDLDSWRGRECGPRPMPRTSPNASSIRGVGIR